MGLNAGQNRFVIEYCVDYNATQAAKRAGYSEKTSYAQGHELLKHPEVQAAIKEREDDIAAAAGLTKERILRAWLAIAEADPQEIMQIRRTACRWCHGYDHAYQWTEAEYVAAIERAIESKKPAPDGAGGFGFDTNAEPHAECPECGGHGVVNEYVADTRKLTGNARKLFAGTQRTKDGLKVLLRDQDAALVNLSKYLGMSVERKEVSGPGGKPMTVVGLKADDLTDDQLAAIITNVSDEE